jgi:hypothetical protein
MTYQYAFYAANTFIIYTVWAYFMFIGICTTYNYYVKKLESTVWNIPRFEKTYDRYIGSHKITRDV